MAIEYLRPSANNNGTIAAIPNSTGTDYNSGDQSAAYAGKSGVGPTGVSDSGTQTNGNGTYSQTVFTTWQTSVNTYSSLVLNVSALLDKFGTILGGGGVYYSLDGGTTWNSIGTLTGSQATYSVTITGTALSNIQVVAQAYETSGYGTNRTVIYDIWTAGTYSAVTRHATAYLL